MQDACTPQLTPPFIDPAMDRIIGEVSLLSLAAFL
jgi:hypothetical protein